MKDFSFSCDEASASTDTALKMSLLILPVVFMGAMNVRKKKYHSQKSPLQQLKMISSPQENHKLLIDFACSV